MDARAPTPNRVALADWLCGEASAVARQVRGAFAALQPARRAFAAGRFTRGPRRPDRPIARFVPAVLTAALATAPFTGCSIFRGQADADADGETLTVEVRNQNYYDATIHAVDGGTRQRIGVVTGNTTETFSFRWQRLDLAFEIDLIGAGTYLTHVLSVSPGEMLELQIRPDLHRLPEGRIGS